MARLKLTAKETCSEDQEDSTAERVELAAGEEDISQVEADLLELMGARDKPPPTLVFGQSWATKALVESNEKKGYFGPGVCRAPKDEVIPDPREGESVVFHDFFVAGLRFSVDPVVP